MPVKHLSKKDIVAAAMDFRADYNMVTGKVYNIEEAIEFGLGIDISPEPNLRQNYNVDAFTMGDFTSIVIDENLLKSGYYGRYRFTLAHEVGHFVLHKETLLATSIDTVSGWIDFHKSLSNTDYKAMERQCDLFASHLLMPDAELNSILDVSYAQLKNMADSLRGLGMPVDIVREVIQDRLAKEISVVFDISVMAAKVRLRPNSTLSKMFS